MSSPLFSLYAQNENRKKQPTSAVIVLVSISGSENEFPARIQNSKLYLSYKNGITKKVFTYSLFVLHPSFTACHFSTIKMSSTIGHHQLDTNSDFNRSPFTSKPDDICSNTTHEASINIPIPSPRQDGGPLTFKPTTDAYSYQDDGRVGDHQRRPAHKYEEIELDEDCHFDERLHCFNGLVPLDHVVIAVNTIVMVTLLSFYLSSPLYFPNKRKQTNIIPYYF